MISHAGNVIRERRYKWKTLCTQVKLRVIRLPNLPCNNMNASFLPRVGKPWRLHDWYPIEPASPEAALSLWMLLRTRKKLTTPLLLVCDLYSTCSRLSKSPQIDICQILGLKRSKKKNASWPCIQDHHQPSIWL